MSSTLASNSVAATLLALSLVAGCTPDPGAVAPAAAIDPAREHMRALSQRLSVVEPETDAARRLLADLHKVKNRSKRPSSHPDVLIEAFAALKTNHLGERYRPGFRARELALARQRRKGAGQSLPWIERGPGNVSGRVRSVLIDQGDASGRTWLAASIGGGIWKTTDAGASWRSTTDELMTLSTTALAQSGSNPDVIYAGTGMGFGRVVDLVGSGVWKSTDRGETWAQLASTANGELLEAINRIVVDPNDPNVLLVCTNDGFSHLGPRGGLRRSGIFKSTDGGSSWRRVFDADAFFGPATDNRVQQLVADPNDFNRIYASVNEVGVILSDDAGETWRVSAGNFALPSDVGNPTGGGFGLAGISVRTELAVAPGNPNVLYAAVERPRGVADLYRSINRGGSWALINDTSGDPNWFNAFGFSGATGSYTAGWFDNTIVVDPFNPNVVYVGGVNLYRITLNQGTRSTVPIAWWTFNNMGLPFAHADHHHLHAVAALGTPFALVDGNDGGVALSRDGGNTWQQITGMVSTQFYGADKKPGEDVYVGGTQDNGSWRSGTNPGPQSTWTFVNGGDGFEAAWNARDPDQVLVSSQGGNYSRSTDGGFNFTPIPDANAGFAPFISKIGNSKADPELVFTIGFNGVKRSDDFGASWTLTPIQGNWLGYRPFDNVEVSIADPQVVWISSRLDVDPPSGIRGGVHVSTDGGLSFTEVSSTLPPELTEASGIGTHPSDPNTAYLLFAAPGTPKIMRTTDLGQTWEDLSGFVGNAKIAASATGFPDVPVYALLVMPFDEQQLWAGTDVGLIVSADGGASWQAADNGLPPVAVFELSIVDDEVIAATQGRGIWTVALPELADYRPPEVTLSPRLNALALRPDGRVAVTADLRSAYDSTEIKLGGQVLRQLASNEADASVTLEFIADREETIALQVVSRRAGRAYSSARRQLSVYPVGLLEDLDSDLNDPSIADLFSGNGIALATPPGFADPAFHTPHPYAPGTEYTLSLRDALKVPCGAATLAFDEIVLAEPGSGNGVFPNPQFFDFAIVEGSRDGVEWVPLADGYDSRANPQWLATYNAGGVGTPSMFVRRTIDLSAAFEPGERIFLRFRLFSDGGVVGWGWAIDNVELLPDAQSQDRGCLFVGRRGISGAWYNPERDGDGWLIEALPGGRATVYWFTYPDTPGGQAWLIGTGTLNQGVITLDANAPLLRPTGARFGDGFDRADVVLNEWGQASFSIDRCDGGTMTYQGLFGEGELPMTRLTAIAGLACDLVGSEVPAAKLAPAAAPLAGISGSWLNPEQPGHGWIIQILEDGGVLVVWFVYTPDGEQAWIIASAGPEAVSADGFTLDAALITDGAAFGPDFDPAAVERIPWGTLSFSFDGCGAGTMSYESVLAEYGQGSHFIERLSNLAGNRCNR